MKCINLDKKNYKKIYKFRLKRTILLCGCSGTNVPCLLLYEIRSQNLQIGTLIHIANNFNIFFPFYDVDFHNFLPCEVS